MKIEEHIINSLPPFPNNPDVPLTLYMGVFDEKSVCPEDFEYLFNQNSWTGSWRNGVYGFHHFHPTAHEVLGCYRGHARIMFGCPEGIEVK